MSRLRVGLRVTPEVADAAGQLAALPELAARAESLGFDLLVVPERLSADGGVPAALPACAAVAAATARMRIASGLLALPLHHPLRVAEDAATLDSLSGGRFELGVGIGAEVEAFGGFGLDPQARAVRFEEALEVVRRAFCDGPVRFTGSHFRVSDVEVYPKPLQSGGPPLWLGARTPDAFARAARLGVGVVVEAEGDPQPYLDAWVASGRELAEARLAFLIDIRVTPVAALRARLARAGASRIDAWLGAATGGAGLVELAEAAAQLRALGPL
jgi:alkanesulfonate monooxygenase SsuD/methylene tetrahydromethanopterin reductase-like flavin-dependent oxidoreductase (luciferase family)